MISAEKLMAMNAKSLLGIELSYFQCKVLCEMWDDPFPRVKVSKAIRRDHLLSVYCLLSCILMENNRIIITSTSYNDIEAIFNQICDIYRDSPNKSFMGYRRFTVLPNKMSAKINSSEILFIPLDQDKIRGLRANQVISISPISQEMYGVLTASLTAISQKPTL